MSYLFMPRLSGAWKAPSVGALLLLLVASPLVSQEPIPDEFFQGLRWQNVGPDRGGRSIGVAGSTARPLEYYFGATGGGLWKSTDGGVTWRVMTDVFIVLEKNRMDS